MPLPPSRIPRSLPSRFAITAAFLPVIFGCADMGPPSVADASLPQVDMLTLKENSDEALKLAQENRLEMQALAARIKELERQTQTLSEQFSALPPFEKVGEQERRLDSLQSRLQNVEARRPAAFNPGPLPVDESPSSPALAAGTLPKPKREPPPKGVSAPEAALYQKALDSFYGRKYDEAMKTFEELQSKYPKGSYADNAAYWIGESQYALGNYAKAVASFRAVLEYKDTEKADDAQLKLGYCHLRLGDRKAAAAEFRKVVSLYPDSEYLERAKNELAKLESSGP